MFLSLVQGFIFQVGSYVGADGVDEWNEQLWQEEFSKYQVMMMIQKIFKDLLGSLSVSSQQLKKKLHILQTMIRISAKNYGKLFNKS